MSTSSRRFESGSAVTKNLRPVGVSKLCSTKPSASSSSMRDEPRTGESCFRMSASESNVDASRRWTLTSSFAACGEKSCVVAQF